jgi:hypothetical protein
MFRKLSMLLVIALLAFTAACSSTSSTTSSVGSNVSATAPGSNVAAASATPSGCPTSNTKSFAKTRFVADIALAGGAFKRWIYTPAKNGKFKHGAHGKVTALIKGAAAGLFVVNRLDAAKNAAEANPTLCKVLVQPLQKFRAQVTGLVGKAKSGTGSINPGDVASGGSYLSDLHSAAAQGGAPFTDNENVSP